MAESVVHAKFQKETFDKTVFGFWIYIMTDCILFSMLFAAYAVLHNNTFGGPSGHVLFNLPFTLGETLILLTSSFTCGLANLGSHANDKRRVILWFAITFLLGLSFIGMELTEFTHLVQTGNSWERSAFLSSFFTLVGTHGIHVSIGLIWMLVIMIKIGRQGLTLPNVRRLTCLRLFWHFLDVVWIFIFTFVYLMEKS